MRKRYPRYKKSGIDWVGEIPEHWRMKKIKHSTYVKGRVGWKGLKSDEFLDSGYAYLVTGTDLKKGKINWNDCYFIDKDRYNEDPYIQLKNDDLLITKDGTIGKIALVKNLKKPACLNSGIFLVRPIEQTYFPQYMFWILSSNVFKKFITFNKTGSTIVHLYQNVFNEFNFPLPSIDEQSQINLYLKKKNKLIDIIIKKKEEQLQYLKDYRQSIINEILTKGLDKNKKMKPSKMKHIGDMPKHWKVIKLKYCGNIKYGLSVPPREIEDGLPLIRATNVERGKINKNKLIYIDPSDIPNGKNVVLKSNDIIVVRSGAYTADSALITPEFVGGIAGYDMVFSVTDANPEFIAFALLSNYLLVNQLFQHTLRAAQPHLNAEELGNSFCLLPPENEQKEIVDFLRRKDDEIRRSIELIKEQVKQIEAYRQSIISEVITGKIDVRESVVS